jgi:hypothetical protein
MGRFGWRFWLPTRNIPQIAKAFILISQSMTYDYRRWAAMLIPVEILLREPLKNSPTRVLFG